ncbi:MAG: glycosyltransferase family 2 protein [Aquabacterium sp.]|jgi:cellulose synthase/poly-beta-1,6-N-acetylglucosamine synthase-like glycosyltransferase|nr:glycosyltransferase family 2 protein [Aquabacterium sp.]MBP8190830.1 glycosyltransferase family 2 protein [Aquabacterium sp.]
MVPLPWVAQLVQDYEVVFTTLSWVILVIGLIQNGMYIAQLPAAWLELRQHSQSEDTESAWHLLVSEATMPISLIVPAYNEEATIVENVKSMLTLRYPDFEIIVVNDGSKDNTLDLLIQTFQLKPITRAFDPAVKHAPIRQIYKSPLYSHLIVVDKENGGSKADASNAGINISRKELFCVVDADSLLEVESLLSSVRPFMEEPGRMIAVGGTIRVLNGCTVRAGQITNMGLPHNPLALIQYIEYIRAFLMARLAWSRWGMLSIISGAFGIFRRDVVLEVGGFSHGTVGEDYELVIKLHKLMRDQGRPYSMRYVPEPVCWTEAPETFKVLATQRKRWQRGALEVFFKHRDMLLRPKYGMLGMVGLPNNLVIDVLGPLAELAGYVLMPILWMAGRLNGDFILAYTALFFLLGVFISICSLILEEMELKRLESWQDLLKLSLVAVVENFGYRQYNSWLRFMGWWEFVAKKQVWGEMTRKGVKVSA